MQIGRLYSTALPRMALMESSRPVCWISSSPRLPVNDRPAQMPTPSSSLQTRMKPRVGQLGERPQQAFAGGDVGHRDDELDPARLDFPDDHILARQARNRPLRRRVCTHRHFELPAIPAEMLAQGK